MQRQLGVSGVYRIVHLPTGRCYVGQSICLYTRKCNHFGPLRRGVNQAALLQEAWNADQEGWVFEVLELCPKNRLTTREQHWFEQLRPTLNTYRRAGITGARGHRYSEKSRSKMLTEELCRGRSERMKALNTDKGFRAAQKKSMKTARMTPARLAALRSNIAKWNNRDRT